MEEGIVKTLEYRFEDVDKTEWGDGPWLNEPDKVQWRDEATGLPCIAKRHARYGHWCGYVGVPEGHPAFHTWFHVLELPVRVHGGLTFGDFCEAHDDTEQGEAHAICHIVEDGEDDRVFWLGFDCGHAFDVSPGLDAMTGIAIGGRTYEPLGYVKEQITSLAEQLAAMEKAS